MSEADVATLAEFGQSLLSNKLFMTSMHFLWIYDYFLTLGDEISYAWSGKKSRIFALFIVNRYTPVLYIVWVNVILFHYSDSLCWHSKWIMMFHTVAVSVLAQTAVTLRIYAVTERNKWIGGALSVIILAQISFGTYYLVRTVINPPARLPQVDLDPFHVCLAELWELGGLIFTIIGACFDVLAFSLIFATARKPGMRYPGIPNLLDTILSDATSYFIFMFACQIVLLLFLCFAPIQIKFMPGLTATIFIPVMASRLMLSLKKASIEPGGQWSVDTMSSLSGREPRGETIHFASRVFESNQIPETLDLSTLGGRDTELESMSRLPQC